jgi:hypothetical protein
MAAHGTLLSGKVLTRRGWLTAASSTRLLANVPRVEAFHFLKRLYAKGAKDAKIAKNGKGNHGLTRREQSPVPCYSVKSVAKRQLQFFALFACFA